MKPARTLVHTLMFLLALLTGGLAQADVYGDVSQLLRGARLAEAETRIDNHLKTKPRDPQMRYFKGLVQRDSGRQTEAIETFTKLNEDFPELPEPYNALAVIYAAQGDYERARLALELALRANPAYATAYENQGDLYSRLARLSYCKALQHDASNGELKTRMATLGVSCP